MPSSNIKGKYKADMSQPVLTTAQKLKLVHYRQEALIRAEYLSFSRMLLSDTRVCVFEKEEWIAAVREIEICLLQEAEPELVRYNLSGYKALGIFFDESFHNVVSIERVPNNTN